MAKSFNASLANNEVVVHIEDKWNDSRGHYVMALVWDGEKVESHIILDGYVNLGEAVVDASEDQIREASAWYCANNISWENLIGSTVVLQRSRKAPNRVPLKVVDWVDAYYSDYYGRHVPEQAIVDVDGEEVSVSSTCIKEVVKSALPVWGIA